LAYSSDPVPVQHHKESKGLPKVFQMSGAATPSKVHFKLRLPAQMPLQSVAVNGEPAAVGGVHKDTVIITTGGKRNFEVIGRMGSGCVMGQSSP
jgi:hypothetical protein